VPVVRGVATAVSGVGVVWLIGLAWGDRRRFLSIGGFGSGTFSAPVLTGHEKERRSIQRAYVVAVGIWFIVWTPLALVAFFAGADSLLAVLPFVIVFGAATGASIGFLFHHRVRARLLATRGLTSEDFFRNDEGEPDGASADRVRTTLYLAYASWCAALATVLLTGIVLADRSANGRSVGITVVTGPLPLGPDALLLVAVVLSFLALRILYHLGLAATTAAAPSDPADRPQDPGARRATWRTYLGAALLPCNPLVGAILGLALQPSLPGSPYLLAWAFLPLTLLGGALLAGCFGRTIWSAGPTSA
jgi:hypothetical protein